MTKRFGELIDNKNTPERQALRDKIVYDYFVENAKGVRFDRVAHIVLGIPSAGKSSVFINDIKKNFGSLELDSDIVKAMLPEYAEGYGANAVHEESSYILESIITPKAIESGANLAFAFVGKNLTKIESLINNLKQNGYEVALALNELPVEKAVNRGFTRWYETGRFVPLSYIAKINKNPDKTPVNTFEKLKEKGVINYYGKKRKNVTS